MSALNAHIDITLDSEELEVTVDGWQSYPLGDLRTKYVRPTPRSIARAYSAAIKDLDAVAELIRRRQRTLRRRRARIVRRVST